MHPPHFHGRTKENEVDSCKFIGFFAKDTTPSTDDVSVAYT